MRVPKLRFPEFKDAGEWEETTFENCLDYLQPTDYLVADENYNDLYLTPVLTAGKTFILGYTNEKNGIYRDALPVIIFDDFTTATQYVDFPFKAKSSAMKILQSKQGTDIKFIFEILQSVKFEVGVHGRNWISNFAPMHIAVPNLPEQQKIADCLSSLDDMISAHSQKLTALKTHKKGLMQQLFPAEGEAVPKLRFPEFRGKGQWKETTLSEIADFASGGTPSKDDPTYWGGKIPWISASSMHEYSISKSDLCITEFAVNDGARTAKKGTLLILVRGSMLYKRIPMGICEIDVAFNQDVKALTIGTELSSEFLLLELVAKENKLLSLVGDTGIGAGKIETDDLKKLVMQIPSISEQQKMATCLSSLDHLITAQNQKIEALKLHKKGLMQQLFPVQNEEIDD